MDNNTFYPKLIHPDSNIEERYIAVFELKSLSKVDALIDAFHSLSKFQDRSCLILHEIAYALGQLPLQPNMIHFLVEVVDNINEYDVVRHEAAEALANLLPQDHTLFQKYSSNNNQNDPLHILRDTCLIGLKKLQTYDQFKHLYALDFCGTKEPAPPYTLEEYQNLKIKDPFQYILDDNVDIFEKYRTLYYLRNNRNDDVIYKMTQLLESDKLGALIKHEICFILGQIAKECPQSILDILKRVCSDQKCPAIARHEALAVFQTVNINKEDRIKFLEQFLEDENQIVRETARVSLKVSEYWDQ